MKSITPKGAAEGPENKNSDPPSGSGGSRNREADFHGEKRTNDTHSLDERPRRAALPLGCRQRGEAVFHRPCADGEPQCAFRRCLPDESRRPCRARRRAPYDRAARRPGETDHARRRQGLRRRGLRQRAAVDAGDAEVAFLLRPTLIEQVQESCEAGEVMPQKSTYFYPKTLDGLVIRTLDGPKG